MKKLILTSLHLYIFTSFCAFAQTVVDINLMKRGAELSPRQYGVFFEEINHAGEGGLYAELIRNRSFENNARNPDYWWTKGNATQAISTDQPLNSVNPRNVKVVMKTANAGIRNEGWSGINVVKGQTYKLTFWMRSTSYGGNIKAILENGSGTSLGVTTIKNSDLSTNGTWKKVTAEITATGSEGLGWLALVGTQAGTVYYDMVSLFPPTYKDRENGCRKDLAEMLEAIHPKFLRFPGGCVVEGNGSVEVTNRVEWKKTIGPIEERSGHYNNNWGYPVTDGLGMLEYLQLAEDLGAEPMFVCNMGMGHGWEDANVDAYIQEAMDAIEFANGDETTEWGKKRIELGHPEPFNMTLLEVGNENYWFGPYSYRYNLFVQRISEKYPYIEFIGNCGWVGEWSLPWRAEFIDQHFYESPTWFLNSFEKYDSYDRSTPKIYVGEYAVTKNCGSYGNMNAALSEAAYMCGMENNSDHVKMASYAPIFMNETVGGSWHPDMIRFGADYSYGTPSYWVQEMMGSNMGRQNLSWSISGNEFDSERKVAMSTWGTTAKYDNVKITAGGKTLYENDFSTSDLTDWTQNGGTWAVKNGELCQTSTSLYGGLMILDSIDLPSSYTLELDATKTGGDEGFLIGFNVFGKQDYTWWNIGGFGNSKMLIEQSTGNYKTSASDDITESVQTGRTYHVKIVVNGTNVRCLLDGVEKYNVDISNPYSRKLFMTASIDEDEETVIMKVVNPFSEDRETDFCVSNGAWLSGEVEYIKSNYGTDENTTSNPRYIAPKTKTVLEAGDEPVKLFKYTMPAYSLSVFKMKYSMATVDPDANVPEPVMSYSFSTFGSDDSGKYPYTLKKDGKISEMKDGNYVFNSGDEGWMDLTKTMANDVCKLLTGDYSISLDLLIEDAATLNNFCWALGFCTGTTSYLGLVNSPGNSNWYYEIKKTDTTERVNGDCGLSIGQWNNLVFSQKDGIGTIYVNGYDMQTKAMTLQPSLFTRLLSATLAKSPFSADDLMSNTLFDNLRIYDQALSGGNAVYLTDEAQKMSTEIGVADGVEAVSQQVAGSREQVARSIYDLLGRRISGISGISGTSGASRISGAYGQSKISGASGQSKISGHPGLYITGGEKFFVR